jgi:hypothetical protein
MDGPNDNSRNLDCKSATVPQFKRDLQTELEKTGGKNTNFDQLMDGATEAQLTSFVTEVCANIKMLTDKYRRRHGV